MKIFINMGKQVSGSLKRNIKNIYSSVCTMILDKWGKMINEVNAGREKTATCEG